MCKLPVFMTSLALLTAVAANTVTANDAAIQVAPWGKLPNGQEVFRYTMVNENGMSVTITNFGARIVNLVVPDKNGAMADVVLGFDHFEDYTKENPYFGAVVGRYGNRICNGQFTLEGKTYNVSKNEKGTTCLHGGNIGFDKKIWSVEPITTENLKHEKINHDEIIGFRLSLISPDGEEGFPGTLHTVIYYIMPKKQNVLAILYGATTDKQTVLNLTQHSYFNLKGAGNGDILDQEVTLFADQFTPVNASLIPTGELRDVTGTPFDFRQATTVGARIDENYDQLVLGGGYDHNWVLNTRVDEKFRHAATVRDPASGRIMDVFTTEPGVQFYAGNFLDGTLVGKGGKKYVKRGGFCFETQHFPDSPNHPNFPSTELKPGEEFKSATVFFFHTDEKK
ncbi:MAG: aldose epimerase family protein [Planctomycetia bacterium]|nr:aldose epimerase family protein [Planctomycetia bacterium]